MARDNKKLNFDLEFLDEESPKPKQPTKTEHLEAESDSTTSIEWNWKNMLIAGGIILFFGWAFLGDNPSTDTTPISIDIPNIDIDAADISMDTSAFERNTLTFSTDSPEVNADIPKTKTNNQICKDTFGLQSYSTGVKNADGGIVCNCQDRYEWNSGRTACVAVPVIKTNNQICKDMNGPYGTYNSSDNTCGCASGYYYGVISKQCVGLIESRNQNCEASYPGTSFLEYNQTNGNNICDCKTGSYWNNDRTACYSLSSFNQSCVNAYGQGSFSKTQDGKRVCDCSYRYDWNLQRTACVTTESINQICEKDVGRNSYYKGYTEDGKYICSTPY